MRVLVTGGSGRLGRWVLRELIEHGHTVVNADRRPLEPEQGMDMLRAAAYREVDLLNIGHIAGAMAGCEAVIHLGAIPSPTRHPAEVVFANNTGATFAVLQTAMLLGVRKAVIASSISAFGMAYAVHPFTPLYAPVDEEHPLLPQDPYALSKEVDERTGEMFHRRCGMSVLAYRFHWIGLAEEAAGVVAQQRVRGIMPAGNLWGWTDTRDAAQACRLGIEAGDLGFQAFNITAADTLCTEPTEDLIRQYAPQTEIRHPIPGTASAWSIVKAQQMLGYTSRHTWRNLT